MNRKILENKLSIGHNGNPEFKSILDKYHKYIYQVFFAPPNWVVQSTRPNDRTSNINYTDMIKEHIEYAREKNYDIKFQLLLNSQCWNGDFRSKELLQRIKDFMKLIEYKFDDISVSDPYLAKTLKKIIPDKTLTLSVITAINDVDMALESSQVYSDIDTICVGHKLTYNRAEIEKIKKLTGKKIKLLINQGCYYNCPDYTLHSVALGHTKKANIPESDGKKLYCDYINSSDDENDWKNLTHQALSPQFLYYYKDCVDIFKLSTRIENDIHRLADIIDGYLYGDTKLYQKKLFMGGGRSVSYENAAIFSLVEYPKNYIEFRNNCNNKCHNCNYCKNLWDEAKKKLEKLNDQNKPTPESLFFRKSSPQIPLYTK